jgi:hypothetical protein
LKEEWCSGDPTLLIGDDDGNVMAMPLAEAKKSEKYIDLLLGVNTYQEAQDLYEIYRQDRDAPKLTPRLYDLKVDHELLDTSVQQEFRLQGIWDLGLWEQEPSEFFGYFADLREDFECSHESLWEEVKNLKFNLDTDPCYNADEIPRYIGECRLWTDKWIPKEIAESIGSPDRGMGLDYMPAEYLYESFRVFVDTFKDFGFNFQLDAPRIEYLAWGWI